MIGFFPLPYEDELAYSIFARYYEKSGYTCYSSVAEDLYVNPKNKPSIEFFNLLTDDATNHIVSLVGSIEKFVLNHTMFNYYSIAISNSNKHQAFNYALSMDIKALMNSLPIPKGSVSRYLRYCPLCAREDKVVYGETYWHRAHQIGVNVCHKHEIYLINSDIPISSNASPSLIKAESVIEDINTITKASPTEICIAKYSIEILNHNYSPDLLYNKFSEILNSYIIGTSYLSPRGAKRNLALLSKDFKEFYKDFKLLNFGEPWQLSKLFTDSRSNPLEIALVCVFMHIPIDEFTCASKHPTNQIKSAFDEEIKRLKNTGLNYRQISSKLGISYDYCKLLGGSKKKSSKNKNITNKGGRKVDWDVLDEITLPKVIELIYNLNSSCKERPKKISIGLVERMIGLKERQLIRLPKCLKYVTGHITSQEKFWGQVIDWAINKLIEESKPINITNIMKITNLRKDNIILAKPQMQDKNKSYINFL